jgi:hypothetical protein
MPKYIYIRVATIHITSSSYPGVCTVGTYHKANARRNTSMDPITTAIIAALSAGAASAATDVAKKTIVDGYEGLKALLKKKFGSNSDAVDAIEKLQVKPESLPRREMLAEELKAVNASADPELSRAAQSLLELIKGLPDAGSHIQIAMGYANAVADRGSTSTINIGSRRKDKDDD